MKIKPTYFEITSDENDHGGHGWRLGQCLWSPIQNKANHDRYSLMRAPQGGDQVIHIVHTRHRDRVGRFFFGKSIVESAAQVLDHEPPSPGRWAGMKSYYRIALKDFAQFKNPLFVPTFLSDYSEEIRSDILLNRPGFYPFTTRGPFSVQTVQGIYLAKSSDVLRTVLAKALDLEQVADEGSGPQMAYAEEKRLLKERYFFSRNPTLVAEAKAKHGTICQTCGFNFEQAYGHFGIGYIEAHHKNPLSERSDFEDQEVLLTSIEDIAVLCSNCHRMIHRKKPAISVERLRQVIEEVRGRRVKDG